jgi:S-adenosylhomocysteine hydrolase
VYQVPPEIDQQVARLFLRSRGVELDSLTPAQREYLGL